MYAQETNITKGGKIVMRSFINGCIAFKDFFIGTMFRRVVSFTILSTIAFLAYSVKVVPNYATKAGLELVWKSDFEKYQQGYCLAENTILSKEEIYKRGIAQFLRKSLTVDRMISASLKEMGLSSGYEYIDKSVSIEYYEMDENEITLSNWYEVIGAKYNAKNRKTGYRDLFMNDFHATPTDPTRYITIDMNSLTAGFTRPILSYAQEDYTILLDQSFLLSYDGHSISRNWVYLHENPNGTLAGEKMGYENSLKLPRKALDRYYKLDNCGNMDYDIEKIHESVLDATIHGG